MTGGVQGLVGQEVGLQVEGAIGFLEKGSKGLRLFI
jgi:hypothetical protein